MVVSLDKLLKNIVIQKDSKIAIACSGGGDSMALALMVSEWAKVKNLAFVALTIDHGLRKESLREAKQVGAWLKKLGTQHHLLHWQGKKPGSNIQEEARKARYRLLTDYCKAHGIRYLLVAHHLEDQAETFLLRLARGSGVDGLSAMAPVSIMHDVTILRPLLDVPKSELLSYLKKRGQAFINDPSNENPVFDRVKMRGLLPTLAKVGLSAERLAKTAAIMGRARAHLEEETGRYLKSACSLLPEGYAVLRHAKTSEEIALRALATLVMLIGGSEVKTRLGELERLHAAMNATSFRGATLGGCIFTHHKKEFLILREPRAAAGALRIKPGEKLLWDNRYEVTLKKSDTALYVSALGQAGWLFCAREHKLENACPDKRILYSLPCLRDKAGWIYAVPHLGLAAQGIEAQANFIKLSFAGRDI